MNRPLLQEGLVFLVVHPAEPRRASWPTAPGGGLRNAIAGTARISPNAAQKVCRAGIARPELPARESPAPIAVRAGRVPRRRRRQGGNRGGDRSEGRREGA